MTKCVLHSLLLVLLLLLPVRAGSLIQPNDSIAICGDSITEQRIYSVYMEGYLLMCAPTSGQKIVQLGWGGEQAPGFLARLDNTLYPFQPTVVTTCYGMNDGHYGPVSQAVTDTYRQSQTAIVESLKAHHVRVIVLGSAKCVDANAYRNDPAQAVVYNQTLGALAQIDQEIAQKEGVIYADVFGATMQAMQKAKAALGPTYVFGGGDGIHPGPNGQLVMAYAFLKALGFDGNVGTLTVNEDLQQAEGDPGQKIISYHNGTLEVESTRYPFCFEGDPSKPTQDNASILRFVPFNEELNRYMLVVKGLTAAKAKVTWGTETKEFTSAQLAAGVNLAAEFLHNPFVEPFQQVKRAVQAQQNYETRLAKQYLYNVPAFQSIFPSRASEFDSIAHEGVQHSRDLMQAAISQVKPVRHTITIQPE